VCHLSLEILEERRLLSVDPILEWNAVALEVNRVSYSGGVVNDEVGPTRSSRALAIEHVAMFDAYNSIHRDFTPYLTQAPDANGAWDVAAVAEAAHDTIVAMYPHQQAYVDTALATTLARVPDGPRKSRGIDVGKYVAQAILTARTNDGSQILGQYIPDGLPGHHVADPLNPDQGFLTPAWGAVETFGITSTAQIPTRTAPALTSDEYTQAFNQVKQLGLNDPNPNRTLDQTEIGIYWGYDVARGLGDPPRLLNQVARVIAEQQDNSVGDNARMFALVNIAMADAGICCWGIKYRDDFWRPIVAIRRAGEDGNPNTIADANWSPLGAPRSNPLPTEHVNFTPPFPSYTSGHSTFGGAAMKTLADFYQTDDINFSIPFDFVSEEFNGVTRDIHDAIPPLILDHVRQLRPRHFVSFSQAAAECAASRVFLGIHWRFDEVEGVRAGDRIADIVFDTKLRPLNGDDQSGKHGYSPTHVATVNFTAQIDAYLNGTYPTFFAPGGSNEGGGGGAANPNQAFLSKVYQDVLHRQVDPSGLASWGNHLNEGMTRTAVAAAILASPERLTNQVTDLYQQMLHRLPDTAGQNAFVAFLAQGGSLTQAETIMMTSPEYLADMGAGTDAGFLTAVYADALDRAPDATGMVSFGQQLSTGVSPAAVASAILTSPEARQSEVQGMYTRFLHRAPDETGFNAFCNALQTGVSDVMAEAAMIGSAEYEQPSLTP
jgi:hypothetical protein